MLNRRCAWVLKPSSIARLLCATLLALALGLAGAAESSGPADPVPATNHQDVLAQIQATQAQIINHMSLRAQQQTEALRAVQAMVIEGQRKSIDLWFAALALLTALIAIAGGVLPFLLTRKDKQLLRAELDGAKEDRAEMRRRLAEARDLVSTIKSHEQVAHKAADALEKFDWAEPEGRLNSADLADKARTVEQDPASSQQDRLRARAVKASLTEHPTLEQALQAFRLWDALVVLDNRDASAWFNAAYSAQDLFGKNAEPGAGYWGEIAKRYYARALQIKPSKPGAARNWARILSDQARVAASGGTEESLVRARDLWQQAGERYEQALQIKPDMHQAASEWSHALQSEADAIAASDPDAATRLLRRARDVLSACAAQDQHAADALAYDLARVHARLGDPEAAVRQLERGRLAGQLPDDWHADDALRAIGQAPAYQVWRRRHFDS